MTGTEGHNADHAAVQTAFQDWDFDPETQVDIPRDTLILHLGSFHGWTVVDDGPILGLAPMLARHDRDHHSQDVLAVETSLDPQILEAIRTEPS